MQRSSMLLLAALLGCTGSPGGPDGAATVVSLHAGTSQTAFSNAAVPIRPAVRVTSRGAPMVGVTVTFRVVSGGGVVQGATQLTDSDGIARVDGWVLGPAGPQTLEAVIGLDPGNPVLFAALAVQSIPAAVAALAGDGITGIVALPVTETPRLRLTDATGRPVAGIPVHWSVSAGNGGFRYADPVTDANGEAGIVKWILGTMAGLNVITARVECSHACAPVNFSATGNAAEVSQMQLVAGDLQQAAVGKAVPLSPTVRLRDYWSNPAIGRVVTFTVLQGGGSLSDAIVSSDAGGDAQVGQWILGPGENVLRAEAEGFSVLFRATGVE